MKVKYFSDTDTAHVEFTDKGVHETKGISENIYIDIDENGNIVSDTLDYITIDYLKPDDRFTFFNLVINNKENYYFPTEFPVKFPKIDIQKYPDSPLECILFLSNIPSEDFSALNGKPQHAFWRKTYKIVIPDYLEMAQ